MTVLHVVALMAAVVLVHAGCAEGKLADGKQPAVVKTAQQLKDAFEAGAPHVHITAHLDLRNLPYDKEELFRDLQELKSLTGACQSKPEPVPELEAVLSDMDTPSGSCRVLSNVGLITWWRGSRPQPNVWIHGLHLMAHPAQYKALEGHFAFTWRSSSGANLWMTNVLFQWPENVFWAEDKVYMSDVGVYDSNSPYRTKRYYTKHKLPAIITFENAWLTLERCSFKRNLGGVDLKGGPVLCRDCEFADNDEDVYFHNPEADIANFYTDIPAPQLDTGHAFRAKGRVMPLKRAPDDFLRGDAPDFTALRKEVQQVLCKELRISEHLPRLRAPCGHSHSVLGTFAATVLAIVLLAGAAAFAVHKLGYADKVQGLLSQVVPGRATATPAQMPMYDRIPGTA